MIKEKINKEIVYFNPMFKDAFSSMKISAGQLGGGKPLNFIQVAIAAAREAKRKAKEEKE